MSHAYELAKIIRPVLPGNVAIEEKTPDSVQLWVIYGDLEVRITVETNVNNQPAKAFDNTELDEAIVEAIRSGRHIRKHIISVVEHIAKKAWNAKNRSTTRIVESRLQMLKISKRIYHSSKRKGWYLTDQ